GSQATPVGGGTPGDADPVSRECPADWDFSTTDFNVMLPSGAMSTYSLFGACFDVVDGEKDVRDCSFVCGMKVLANGLQVNCPQLANGKLDFRRLQDPVAPEFQDCAYWHGDMPGQCPTWSSGSGHTPPMTGNSEPRDVVAILDCGGSQTQIFEAAGCGGNGQTTGTFVFTCAACE
ncbi:MAG: hypothetical protein AAFP86_18085, partial [Planctomycetota bacterium]